MKEPIVDSEDPELVHNPYGVHFLHYKGKLFTGTLIFTDTTPVSFQEYTDGDYDGCGVSYHKWKQAIFRNWLRKHGTPILIFPKLISVDIKELQTIILENVRKTKLE